MFDNSTTLWSNHDRSRFFLIPDDRSLPNGPFELKTITGRQQFVDETTVLTFELSRDDAKAWLNNQLSQVLATANKTIINAIHRWRSPSSPPANHSDRVGP